MDSIMNLLKDSRFWAIVFGGIGLFVSAFVPELQERYDIIVPGLIALVLAVFGGVPVLEALSEFLKREEVNIQFDRAIGEWRLTAKTTETPVDDILVNLIDMIEDVIGDPDDSAEDEVEAPAA